MAERLRFTTAPDVIVLAVADREPRDAALLLRLVTRSRPRAAVVVYCDSRRAALPSVAGLAAAGVHQFIFAGVNDGPSDLRAILESARQQCAAEVVLSELRGLLPEVLYPIAEAALARPRQITAVQALAGALGVHRKTLFNRCTQSLDLPPAEVLAWIRLALVGYLLESTTSTVEAIALKLGYPSHTALRNRIRRYTGLRATVIRGGGGLQLVLNAMRRRLEGQASFHEHSLHLRDLRGNPATRDHPEKVSA